MKKKSNLVALLTNNDDDVYCFRKELVEALIADGYQMLISCPDGPKFELMRDIPFIYDNPDIDRRGTNPIKDLRLLMHYRKLFKKYKPCVVLAYTAKPNVYASIAAHQLGIPVINNLTGLGSVVNEKGMMKSFIMWLFKLAYQKSACMMFQNETNMQVAISEGMVKGRYRLIPGSGVDTNRYPLQPYPGGGMVRRENQLFLTTLDAFCMIKVWMTILRLLSALKKIIHKRSSICLVLLNPQKSTMKRIWLNWRNKVLLSIEAVKRM